MSQGLYTAVTGVKANQVRLNVISNNVANMNTIAFKESTVNFKTLFSQTISEGSRPGDDIGGINPRQVGYGTTVAEVKQNFGQGGSTFTGRQGDMQIDGDGFFTVLKSGSTVGDPSAEYYLTRAGNFTTDGLGYLTTTDGNRVLGTGTVDGDNLAASVKPIRIPMTLTIFKEFDANNEAIGTEIGISTSVTTLPASGGTVTTETASLINFSIAADGSITASYDNGDRISVRTDPASTNAREILHIASGNQFAVGLDPNLDGQVAILDNALYPEELQLRLANVVNPSGLIHQGNSNFTIGPNSGDASYGIATTGGRGLISDGVLETSNVDITSEFVNMVISQRALEASSKIISTQSEILRTIINIV